MSGVNKVILVGRIGRQPEVKTTNVGKVANFTLATSEKYKDRNSGETKETTDWHNIVLWKGLAEIVEKYCNKGDLIYIEGKLRTRSWDKDGEKRYVTEVIGESITLLGSTKQQSSSPSTSEKKEWYTQQSENVGNDGSTDDLPF